MDIHRVLSELRAERDRLNEIILALERLGPAIGAAKTPKRRGRKFMDERGRREVSERMKRYWAEKLGNRPRPRTNASSAQASARASAA